MSTNTVEGCLVPNCTKAAHCRGLCNGHYTYAALLVRKNKTTWAELEKAQRCFPIKTKKPKKGWFHP